MIVLSKLHINSHFGSFGTQGVKERNWGLMEPEPFFPSQEPKLFQFFLYFSYLLTIFFKEETKCRTVKSKKQINV